jgi:hypothetical protein
MFAAKEIRQKKNFIADKAVYFSKVSIKGEQCQE